MFCEASSGSAKRAEPMKIPWLKLMISLSLFAFVALFCGESRGEDWVFYTGSAHEEAGGPGLRDWYGMNRLKPLPREEAKTDHYYDKDSVAFNSPFPGGTVRVWEKSVIRRETKIYEEAREEVWKEEEARRDRKLSPLEAAHLFPDAIRKATKEIKTLYEINCDTREATLLEINLYDRAGKRMSREFNRDATLWFGVQSGTVMDLLQSKVCKEP